MKKRIAHFFVLSCEKATLLIEKELQGSLSPLERIQLKIHLSICQDCTCYRVKSRFLDSCIDRSTTEFESKFTQKEIEDFKRRLMKVYGDSVQKSSLF